MNNKTLLITGASSDIGINLLNKIADNFDHILAHYVNDDSHLKELKNSLGEKLILLKADFADFADTKKFIENIKNMGYIPTHIVHLPAGKVENIKFNKIEWQKFETDFAIAFRSLTLILQEFLPIMSKNKYGKVVVMLTSYTLNIPPKYLTSYVTSKYALLGLVKTLSQEYAGKGITINGVSPSMIDTKFLNSIPELVKEQNALNSPTGKNLNVDEVVPTFEFLLSDSANAITGQNIAITNGNII